LFTWGGILLAGKLLEFSGQQRSLVLVEAHDATLLSQSWGRGLKQEPQLEYLAVEAVTAAPSMLGSLFGAPSRRVHQLKSTIFFRPF
jgi:hypothetical protein